MPASGWNRPKGHGWKGGWRDNGVIRGDPTIELGENVSIQGFVNLNSAHRDNSLAGVFVEIQKNA